MYSKIPTMLQGYMKFGNPIYLYIYKAFNAKRKSQAKNTPPYKALILELGFQGYKARTPLSLV